MEVEKLNQCKKVCHELGKLCHNTQNRVISLMCEKDNCKYLGDYLQRLKVMESLCNYMCLCCCEMEKITQSTISEFKNKCKMLIQSCEIVNKKLSSSEITKLNCDKIKKLCDNTFVKTKKTKKR